MNNIENIKIITNGKELVDYLYYIKAEKDLKDIFQEYFSYEKNWNIDEIKDFFKEHTAIDYYRQLLEQKKYERPEHYFKGFYKYRPNIEYDKFIQYCEKYYQEFFDEEPDYIKNTESETNYYFLEYDTYYGNKVILTIFDLSEEEQLNNILQKFSNNKLFRKYFINLASDLSFNYEPDLRELENRIARYKYVIYYRGGSGYIYAVWGYKPSIIRR
jgi:hypothetical protein